MTERILITGADGNLGGALVKEILDCTKYDVVAISNSGEKFSDMLKRENIVDTSRVIAMNQDEFFLADRKKQKVVLAVHMAFSRADRSNEDIAGSLDYAKNVFGQIHNMEIPRVVYISSQSVYGNTSAWRREDLKPAPGTPYAMAKYAGEKLFEMQFYRDSTQSSILRLDYVVQSQKLVRTLCTNAKEKGVIKLRGGKQTFSYIDKSDVAKAIVALFHFKGKWKPVYNVGPHMMRYTLVELAEIVKTIAEKNGASDVKIILDENDTELWSGMDSALFMKDTGWKPSKDIRQMAEAIYEEV